MGMWCPIDSLQFVVEADEEGLAEDDVTGICTADISCPSSPVAFVDAPETVVGEDDEDCTGNGIRVCNDEEALIPVGTCVEICGLIKATSLNQQHGYIMSFNHSTSRYEVQLNEDGSTKYVKPEQVKRVDVFDFEGIFDESAS